MTATLTAIKEKVTAKEPTAFKWTLEHYHRAIEAGVLDENTKAELIHGDIIEKMPIGTRHADCVGELTEYFVLRLGRNCKYFPQNPLSIPNHSEPEPDFMILDKAKYVAHKGKPVPDDVQILVEVADSTLNFDRNTKATLYAQANIAEYWIINLQDDLLELHLQPDPATGVYNSINRYPTGAEFESPFCGAVKVADLLPPKDEEAAEE